ncbi:MAG: hypothetical protein KAI53_03685 [Candidatus Aenigmarchaeota archaeon]|nr:hypothetical protein [Candidatus Aenigmarchaeota archaeon]
MSNINSFLIFSIIAYLAFLMPFVHSSPETHNVTVSLLYSATTPYAGSDYALANMPQNTIAGIIIPDSANSISSSSNKVSINYGVNTKAYIVYTKGIASAVEKRMDIVRNGVFDKAYNPSFGFPIAEKNTIEVGLFYLDINIEQNELLRPGIHQLLINNNGTAAGKSIFILRTV